MSDARGDNRFFGLVLMLGGVLMAGTLGPCAFGLAAETYGSETFPLFAMFAIIPAVGLGAAVAGLVIFVRGWRRPKDGQGL